MMCHLDKTSCSRYNTAAYFGVDAGSAVAARNAFWGERGVCSSSGPKTHFGVDTGSVAVAAVTVTGDEKKCHVECLGGWR